MFFVRMGGVISSAPLGGMADWFCLGGAGLFALFYLRAYNLSNVCNPRREFCAER